MTNPDLRSLSERVWPVMSPEELDSRIQAAADLLIAQYLNPERRTEQRISSLGALMRSGIEQGPSDELSNAVWEAYIDKANL